MNHPLSQNQSNSPTSLSAHDDEMLKKTIHSILENADQTCQSKSSQIMSAILNHRKKRVMELEREKILPANARFLQEGGGSSINISPSPAFLKKRNLKVKKQQSKKKQNIAKKK